ncbi:ATP-binding protein [Nocardiopsis alba]|uniref:ATP-binding protein n=1 Tax=Nocardiopsis alba TaxID=53437 RepID=UPI0033DB8EBD
MRVDMLGPLRVELDGRSTGIGGPRLRALLARLALEPGRVIGHRTLIEDLWPESGEAGAPESPMVALHSLVYRLRRALPEPEAVCSEPAGYRLALPDDAVDILRFERLARQGREELRAGRHAKADEYLSRALASRRGEPLSDIPRLPFVEAAALHLEEIGLGAVEDHAEASSFLPGGGPPIVELERLATAHPLRERLRALLVGALAAEGRRAEALAAYEIHRSRLAEELGTDPGPELRALHLSVLREEHARAAAPAPPARGGRRTPLTTFVGREDERRLVAERLAEYRLVTLVGPGGVGKTRLASVAASDVDVRTHVVELGPVSDPGLVPHTVAAALGLRSPVDPVADVVDALSTAETLLVLDCCERVVDAAAALAVELLERCPDLRVLTTTREPLDVPGEALCPVPPLSPEASRRLFIDRARAGRPDLHASEETVDRICRRLDGLPLAIELAAARLRSMTVEALAEGLEDRLGFLAGGNRLAPPHHRDLRGVVAWSWEPLTGVERAAAERLSVFPQAFTTRHAEYVGVRASTLYSLVDRSLVERDGDRYRMLDTIREYGNERLVENGGALEARDAHAACFLDLAERAEPHLRGPGQTEWQARLALDHDNLLASLGHLRDHGDRAKALRSGAVLGLFWAIRGDHATAVFHLRSLLDSPAAPGDVADELRPAVCAAYLLNATFAGALADARTVVGPPPKTSTPVGAFVAALLAMAESRTGEGRAVLEPHLDHPDPWTRGMLRLARAFLDGTSGDIARGADDVEHAVRAFRETGDHWGSSLLLMSLAYARSAVGDTEKATALLEEALELSRALGTHHGQRVWSAMAHIDAGATGRARELLEEVVADATSVRRMASARICLADLARYEGDLEKAGALLALVESAAGEKDLSETALYHSAAGHLAAATGGLDGARRHLRAAFALADAMPDLPMLAQVSVGTADVLRRGGAPERAARVMGAAHVVRGGPAPRHPDVVRLTHELSAHRVHYDRAARLSPEEALALLREEHGKPG